MEELSVETRQTNSTSGVGWVRELQAPMAPPSVALLKFLLRLVGAQQGLRVSIVQRAKSCLPAAAITTALETRPVSRSLLIWQGLVTRSSANSTHLLEPPLTSRLTILRGTDICPSAAFITCISSDEAELSMRSGGFSIVGLVQRETNAQQLQRRARHAHPENPPSEPQ